LRDAAREGQLIVLRCNLCRRRVNFLVTDLIKLMDPTHIPIYPCGRCGTKAYVRISVEAARTEDIGKIVIRRPSKLIQTWRSAVLGDWPLRHW
jgi:hypothetical protein